ncbi:MAG: DUF2442 domain-containing protein [Candidatus Sumerlaeota bacterium]|nr:DUF2442 domain-containing protein [Candidatus Sumerlaeota bacterium]
MNKAHEVQEVAFRGDALILVVDGQRHEFAISGISRKLAQASPEQRTGFVVSPSGYGIHWIDLDEDLSIDGLLGIKHHCPVPAARARR